MIVTILQSFSQGDSLIVKDRKYLSLGTNFYQSSFIPNDLKPSIPTSTYSNLSLNLSLGKFTKKGNASIFTLGIEKGGNKTDYDKTNISKESKWGLNFAYTNEKYKMLLRKVGVFVGIELGVSYNRKTGAGFGKLDSVTYNNESETNDIAFYSKAYPGIIYFVNSRWAITAIVGNLNLVSITHSYKQSSNDYGDNGKVFTSSDSSKSSYYNISPTFVIANSGIGLRYFLK
jgi:hypothetical protein